MSDQTPKALKQSLLEQINADKKAVETLSDEELEAVAGGMVASTVSLGNQNTGKGTGLHVVNANTGAVEKPKHMITVVVMPSPQIEHGPPQRS